jgi:hypothetical protein
MPLDRSLKGGHAHPESGKDSEAGSEEERLERWDKAVFAAWENPDLVKDKVLKAFLRMLKREVDDIIKAEGGANAEARSAENGAAAVVKGVSNAL